jgi:hypothetical protein
MEDFISVAGDSPRSWRNAGRLINRLNERRVLDRFVNAVRGVGRDIGEGAAG